MKLDVVTSYPHYTDHIAPVWHAIPTEHQGTFYAHYRIEGYPERYGIQPTYYRGRSRLTPLLRAEQRLTLVASYQNLLGVNTTERPVVYMEHGNGQTFEGRVHPSYANGLERKNVHLILVPAKRVADKVVADAAVRIVGCPKLDYWHRQARKPHRRPPLVALSFHWDATERFPESRSAWPHYTSLLPMLTAMRNAGEIDLLGHGHPLIIDKLIPHYQRHGIRYTRDFSRVLAEADVYVNDSSSTLYEFASLNRPVVVLNAPWYRRDVEHGLRFWEYADVGIQVDEADDVPDAIRAALDDPPTQRTRRKRAVNACYAFTDGRCAERAADAILDRLMTMESEAA